MRSLLAAPEGRRFRALLAMLFVVVVAMPIGGGELGGGVRVVHLLFVAMLLSAVYGVGRTRGRMVTGLVLVGAGFALDVARPWLGTAGPGLSAIVYGLFMVYCVQQMLAYVLSDGPVTTDKLLASLCVYMLIALTFAIGYHAIEEAWPGSIRGFDHGDPTGRPTFAQAGYFSFVTQTTLGYGDFTPAGTPAGRHVRTLAVVQAVVGQLYLAVLVARLVGLHIAQGPDDAH